MQTTVHCVSEFHWLPARTRKDGTVEKVLNRHMLKQPLLKFELLWKKFHGRKRSQKIPGSNPVH